VRKRHALYIERGAFGAQTVISDQLSINMSLSSACQSSMTPDNKQVADPAAVTFFCPSRREPNQLSDVERIIATNLSRLPSHWWHAHK